MELPKDQELNNKGNISGKTFNELDIKNNFDNVSIVEVYNHFKKGLVDKKYMNKNELLQFITLAFDKMEIPAQPFKLKHIQAKQKIIAIFYDYYKNIATKPHGKQKLYATLLCNYFEGFKIENVSTNFNK